MPGRAIHNDFIARVKEGETQPKKCLCHCIKTCDVKNSPYCIVSALYNAFRGDLSHGYAFCGSNAFRAKKIEKVKEIFNNIKEEFNNYQKKVVG